MTRPYVLPAREDDNVESSHELEQPSLSMLAASPD